MANPKCVICGGEGTWFCATCGSNCFCDSHACRHIVANHPEELGLKPRKSVPKEPREPDVLIIPKDYDPNSGQPPAPLWQLYTKDPEPKKSSPWVLVLSAIIVGLVLLALFAR